MKSLRPLLAYNCCQLISIIYALFEFNLNQLNPSKHLPKVIAITFGFQLIGLLSYHSMAANKSMSHSGHSGQAINYLQVVTNVMKSTVFYYVTIVLLGAPLFSEQIKTLYLSVLLTILTTLPIVFVCKPNNMISSLMNAFNRINDFRADSILTKTSLLTLIGGWFGAFFIVLDWMQPWQEWPITICLGAMFTNLLCNAFVLVFVSYKAIKKLK